MENKRNAHNIIEIMQKFNRKMRDAHEGDYPSRGDVMGYFGEIAAQNELDKRGIPYIVKGGQAGYDILANGKKLEVRTSQLKSERCFPKNIMAWGWKLQPRNSRENKEPTPLKCDMITLVKLEDDWENYEFFMFSKEEVEKMDEVHYGGYQTVARSIYLFKNPMEEAIKADKYKMISKQCIEFNKNPEKHILNWDIFLGQ